MLAFRSARPCRSHGRPPGPNGPGVRGRPAVAALEFCLVAGVLFMLLLGMVEVSRAMMALGNVANAARVAARAGAVTSGSYSDVVAAAQSTLTAAGIQGTPQVTVTIDGNTVTDNATFRAAATPGKAIAVRVGVTYADVSWLPGGTGIFLSPGQTLSETAVLCKEG